MIHFIACYSPSPQVDDLQASVGELEVERDFYFSKLRDIETKCQENEGLPLVADIMEIMYATQVSLGSKSNLSTGDVSFPTMVQNTVHSVCTCQQSPL